MHCRTAVYFSEFHTEQTLHGRSNTIDCIDERKWLLLKCDETSQLCHIYWDKVWALLYDEPVLGT